MFEICEIQNQTKTMKASHWCKTKFHNVSCLKMQSMAKITFTDGVKKINFDEWDGLRHD